MVSVLFVSLFFACAVKRKRFKFISKMPTFPNLSFLLKQNLIRNIVNIVAA